MKKLLSITILLVSIGLINSLAQPLPTKSKINIINGKIWVPSIMNAEGSQLFLNNLNLSGSIALEKTWYSNVLMGYDLEKDEVLATIKTNNQTKRIISLCKQKLKEFNFNYAGQAFSFKRGDYIHPDLDSNSYYQVVSSYNLTYIIHRKRIKILQQKSRKYTFLNKNEIYLLKENKLYSINKKKDLLEHFELDKAEVKSFIQSNKLKINPKHPMDAIPVILTFDS